MKGHSVTYVCSRYRGCETEESIDGVHIVRLGPTWLFSLKAWNYYLRHCRGKVDLVYEDPIGGSKVPLFGPLYIKEPMIAVWHQRNSLVFSYQFAPPIAWVLSQLEKALAVLHRNTTIHTPSTDSAKDIQSLGFRKENIRVIPISIREEWLNIKVDDKVREPLVIWLGKIRRYKCPHHVILAMKQVCQEYPQAKLIIAGKQEDSKYEIELRHLAQKIGIQENVIIRTNLTETEKRDLLLRAKILVLPSPIEGFGIVVLEANACGTPVIASSGVPKDAVQHLNNGLRYPFSDIPVLSRDILQVLKDDELYRQLCSNSLTFVHQFAWNNVGVRFEDMVKQMATQQKSVLKS